MASTKQLDPRVLEFLKRANNGKAQAEADYAGLPAAPVAHPEDWNHPPPEGSIKDDPYGNAILDSLSGGIAGALRPNLAAAVQAARPAAQAATRRYLDAGVKQHLERGAKGIISEAERASMFGNPAEQAENAFVKHWAEKSPDDMAASYIRPEPLDFSGQVAGSTKTIMDVPSGTVNDLHVPTSAPIQGEVPITGVNKAPTAPGQAPRPDGLSPEGVVKEQMEKLNNYKPREAFSRGGVVGAAATTVAPHHVYTAAHDCVAKYCSGGVANYAAGGPVEPTDVNDEHTPELIPQAEMVQSAPPQSVPQSPVPQGAEQPVADPKVAEGNAQLRQDDDPAARRLALLEQYRASALQGSEPTTGQRVARGIGSALTAFGGVQPTDFAAEDRANRGEINANYDRQRKDFLTAPGELAARAGNDSNSQDSMKFRGLVAKTLGIDVNGLSSAQVTAALPFIQTANAAKVSGNQLEMQREMEKGRQAVEAHKEDVDAQKLEIDRQNAESNRIRAEKSGEKVQATEDRGLEAAVDNAASAPEVQIANKSLESLKVLEPLLNSKKPLTSQQVLFLASNLGKIEGGGVASEHVIHALTSPTLLGEINKYAEYLTGNPGDAGVTKRVQEIYKPYAAELKKILQGVVTEHTNRIINNHSKLATPGLVKHLRDQASQRFPVEVEPSVADKIKSKYGDYARPSD